MVLAGIPGAKTRRMMDITLSILALIAGGVTLELFTTARASMPHHDEQGFGFGADADEYAPGNPS
jgi:hypothetical protein